MTWIDWCVLVLAGFYLVFALDDLVFDVTYWLGRLTGWWRRPRVTYGDLKSLDERRAAIITPAWREHDVIARMLLYNMPRIDYDRFDYFVGTYRNDPETRAEVDRIRVLYPNLRIVVHQMDGPTSKADCVNAILSELVAHEQRIGVRYEFVVMHDAEDIVHPLELRLLNWFFRTDDADFVQLPVLSTPPKWYDFVAGTYIDEFAEMYAKNMPVREKLSGFVPSAGVATGVRREAIDRLFEERNGVPFATNSLTEDYDLGLGLTVAGRPTRYLAQAVRVRTEEGEHDELVATWAPFPHTFTTAVRQRTRWMAGIVFQGWQHWGWPRGLALRWMLAHDRRGPLGYLVVFAGYVLLLYIIAYTWMRTFADAGLPAILSSPLFDWLFVIGLLLMSNRLLQRAIATRRFYGNGQAVLSLLRTPFSNLVNMTSSLRAGVQYFRSRQKGIPMSWDKTEHSLPPEVRATMRLGERLIADGKITTQQLVVALRAQRDRGRPLGEILVEQGSVTQEDVITLVREQVQRDRT